MSTEATAITIPMAPEAARPPDPAAELVRRAAAAEGVEVPLAKPMSRRAERVAIAVVAAVVAAGTAAAFTMARPGQTGVGWFVGGVGGAVVVALVWAHLRGGMGGDGATRRSAATEPATATLAPAAGPFVAPATYRLASVRARVVAGVLDQALAFSPLLPLGLVHELHLMSRPLLNALFVAAFALFLLGPAFSLWLTNGRTPGRKLLGLRVVRTDGLRMTLRGALRRELGGIGKSNVFYGLLALSTDDLRRSAADARAGTVVVVDDGARSAPPA